MPPKVLARDIVMVPIDEVRPHPENPRRGDAESVAASMDELDIYDAIKVQRSTGYVLVGNHRYLAMRLHGLTEVPVIYLDVDDARALKILIRDNRESDKSEWDDRALLVHLTDFEEADDLDGTGYDEHDVALLRALLEEDAGPPAGPPPQSAEVQCQIGGLKWKVSREQFERWEAEMLAQTGGRHDEMVGEARARLAL